MTRYPRHQESKEWAEYFANLARDIRAIWDILTTSPRSQSSAASTSATPTSATPTSATPTNTTPAPTPPYLVVKHETNQVSMSVNTDALAAEWSMRNDQHEERIPCRERNEPAAGAEARQDGPNFVFGDAAQPQKRQPQMMNIQYTNSSTTVTVHNNDARSLGLNVGLFGLGLGAGLGSGMPGMDISCNRPFSLAVTANPLAVIACVLLAIWVFRG